MTLLDVLGLTTDEVPFAVGAFFRLVLCQRAKVLQVVEPTERALRMSEKSVCTKTDITDISC
jgi:hypothetical protein